MCDSKQVCVYSTKGSVPEMTRELSYPRYSSGYSRDDQRECDGRIRDAENGTRSSMLDDLPK